MVRLLSALLRVLGSSALRFALGVTWCSRNRHSVSTAPTLASP